MNKKNSNRVTRTLLAATASIAILGGLTAGAQAPGRAPAAPAAPAAAAPAATQTTLKGNAENGKKLYVTYACYSCHGSQGRAGGAAPAIVPVMSVDALIKYVRKPTGGMPPFTSKSGVTEQELVDIHAYLATIPKDVDAKTIPLLQNLNTP
jgi:mono/diheme cytochrome c family protein